MSETTHRILGIDPGLRATGWGVVELSRGKLFHLANGTVKTQSGDSLAARLVTLEAGLLEIVARMTPTMAAVEKTFVNRDGAATLKLGQARAIALLVPARAGLDVAEYAPNEVKKIVTGAGHADKRQIAKMVRMLLPKAVFDSEHSTDALAIAITHAYAGLRKNQLAAVAQ